MSQYTSKNNNNELIWDDLWATVALGYQVIYKTHKLCINKRGCIGYTQHNRFEPILMTLNHELYYRELSDLVNTYPVHHMGYNKGRALFQNTGDLCKDNPKMYRLSSTKFNGILTVSDGPTEGGPYPYSIVYTSCDSRIHYMEKHASQVYWFMKHSMDNTLEINTNLIDAMILISHHVNCDIKYPDSVLSKLKPPLRAERTRRLFETTQSELLQLAMIDLNKDKVGSWKSPADMVPIANLEFADFKLTSVESLNCSRLYNVTGHNTDFHVVYVDGAWYTLIRNKDSMDMLISAIKNEDSSVEVDTYEIQFNENELYDMLYMTVKTANLKQLCKSLCKYVPMEKLYLVIEDIKQST